MKVHAIIEKTATFVSKQGAQMEIILKTKQRNNQQFEFLNYDNELNPYYRHLVNMIKLGKYKPAPPVVEPEPEDLDESHYLHPSLTSSEVREKEPEPAPITSQEFLESIQSKLPAGQIANTSYAKLLNNLKKHASVVAPPTSVHQLAKASDTHRLAPPPPPPPPVTTKKSDALSSSSVASREHSVEGEQKTKERRRSRETSDQSTGGTENRKKKDPVHGPLIVPPPPDQQPIIDKMADYVARNGPEFEVVVKMKNDERFRFLESGHIHHNYYEYKKQMFLKEMGNQKLEESTKSQDQESSCEVEPKPSKKSQNERVAPREPSKTDDREEINSKTAHVSKAVSFSIKAKEEESTSLKTRTALLYDSTDSEDEGGGQGSSESETASLVSKSLPHNSSRSSMVAAVNDKPPGSTEEIERKQAEHKLADRLAAAAREKLARESKERQLQAQRKRKAAMFINMLKDIDGITSNSAPTGSVVAAEDLGADAGGSSFDSPFSSSVPSRSMSPAVFLVEPTAPALSTTATLPPIPPVPTTSTAKLSSSSGKISRSFLFPRKRSRSRSNDRSKSPRRRHRKRSKTPPSAYHVSRRSASKSPPRHGDRDRSRHKSKHSRPRSRSRSHSEAASRRKDVGHKRKSPSHGADHKSKKESESKKSSSHKKKSSKEHDTPRHHKSKKHKSKSKRRRSASPNPEDDLPPRRPKSTVNKDHPVVVDLTGSPRAEEFTGRKFSDASSDDLVPHIEMLTKVHAAWKTRRVEKSESGAP